MIDEDHDYNSDNNDDGIFDEDDEVTVLNDKDHPIVLSCQKLIKDEKLGDKEEDVSSSTISIEDREQLDSPDGEMKKFNIDDFDIDFD